MQGKGPLWDTHGSPVQGTGPFWDPHHAPMQGRGPLWDARAEGALAPGEALQACGCTHHCSTGGGQGEDDLTTF